MQHFWHHHFICSKFNILQIFLPSFWIMKTLEMPRHAWDRETIFPKAREAPDEEHCRTQDRPRVSLGLVLVLGTQTWFGATSLSPGPAQPQPMSCSWPSCSWGREKGTFSLDSILGKSMRPQPGIPFFFEVGKTSIMVITQHHCPGSFSTPSQPLLSLGSSPSPPGLYRILMVGKILRSSSVIFLRGKNSPRLLPPHF